MKTLLLALVLALSAASALRAQPDPAVLARIRQAALASHSAYDTLGEICDRFGGRLTGSSQNENALAFLVLRLRAAGLDARLERFTMPGWVRGDDEVELTAPVFRRLRVAALGYTQPHAPFAAAVVDLKQGREADYAGLDAAGKIGVLSANTPLALKDYLANALRHGVAAILFIDRVNGGQLLCRTGSFTGQPLPIPIFSVTQEEGLWLQRALAKGLPVRARMVVRSECREVQTANVVVRLPGRTPDTVVLGGHFDSWDLGQGAIDNGLGIAQVFATAELLQKYSPRNLRTVELVWFNGEEEGLWGSRTQAARDRGEPIVAMINLDMAGWPTAVNAMGYDSLIPALTRFNDALGADKLKDGVANAPWRGSDHISYMLTGVRAVTIGGPIPPEVVRYYHDFGDTFDKVDPKLVAASSADIAALTYTLANDPALTAARLGDAEVAKLFEKYRLDTELRAAGIWPFP